MSTDPHAEPFGFPELFDALQNVLEARGLVAAQSLEPLREALAGRYRIVRELGRGAMGVVYLADEIALERRVAVKLLPASFAAELKKRKGLLREARTAAQLFHPNIVPIHAVEEAGGFVFFTMEYVEGETLTQRVHSRGPLPVGEATRILHDVARAVGYAHQHGVIHRDLKPDNIMIESESGRVVVMDFGIAQFHAQPEQDRAGYVAGTAPFMSPEQVEGASGDERSDVYALGVTAHFAVTGELPFKGPTLDDFFYQHVRVAAPALHLYGQDLDPTFARSVSRCLEKNPGARFSSGDELADELGTARELRRSDLPVPVRVFVERSMRYAAWISSLSVVGAVILISLMDALWRGNFTWAAGAAGLLALLGAGGAALLLPAARSVFRKGYTRADIIHALSVEVERAREITVFEHGSDAASTEHIARQAAYGGLGLAGVGAALFAFVTSIDPIVGLGAMLGGTVTAVAAFVVGHLDAQRRSVRPKALLLRFWQSRVGGWVALVAALGLRRER